ncbi:MAG: CHAT domain-containing protein, partial [Candidatus Eisenbacteria bacterium]|nr:CHAT domain-containing protein [Candidatus Eisenbacteria bacterium]
TNMGEAQKAVELLESASAFIESIGDTVVYHRTLVPKAEAYRQLGDTEKSRQLLADALQHYEDWRRRQSDPTSAAGLFLRGSDVYGALALVARDEGKLDEAWNMCERGRSFVLKERLAPRAFEEPMELAEVQEFLAQANGTLIHYSDPTVGALYRFVITPTDIRMDEISSVQPLALEAHNILDLFAAGESDEICAPGLDRLGKKLLGGESAPEIFGERVYIVPPSQLEGFPFETLPFDGVPFGEQFAVTYLPSASTLRMEQGSPAAGMLAVADPITDPANLNDGPGEVFRGLRETPLPYARAEVDAIKSSEAVVLMGEEASRANLLGQLENPFAVLHIATHTLVDPVNPARSALVLAQDGSLSAEELEKLSVQCDLVTLSGCQTSGGFTYLGEGVFGLARSFLLAGAKTVVSSLWDVEDRAASRFMTLFYEALRSGEAKDQALRTARTAMAKEGFPHRDRSAFVLAGVGTGTVALGARAQNTFDPNEIFQNPIFAVGVLLTLLLVAAMAINAMRGSRR